MPTALPTGNRARLSLQVRVQVQVRARVRVSLKLGLAISYRLRARIMTYLVRAASPVGRGHPHTSHSAPRPVG